MEVKVTTHIRANRADKMVRQAIMEVRAVLQPPLETAISLKTMAKASKIIMATTGVLKVGIRIRMETKVSLLLFMEVLLCKTKVATLF